MATSAVGLLTLILIGSAFTAPFNNSQSSATINKGVVSQKVAKKTAARVKAQSTPKVEKSETTAKTEAASTNDSGSVFSKLTSISPAKIKSAAKSQSKAASLIQSETTLTQAQSQKAAQEIFTGSQYTALRSDLSSGNWLGAYGQYQQLSSNGSLKALQQSLGD